MVRFRLESVERGASGNVMVTTVVADRNPDQCPACHRAAEPVERCAARVAAQVLERIFQCPSANCAKHFIARYRPGEKDVWLLSEAVPLVPAPPTVSGTIAAMSPTFRDVYIQAAAAEGYGLAQVCGPGYRKALEFLIKDYLCARRPADADTIRGSFLGRCIAKWVENDRVKAVASRAAWLGNDESHYLRVWAGRDLEDLKSLIQLTVRWIEMEAITEEAIRQMPEPGAAGRG